MANGIYSKKVIKHFQNPHNYGRMKNPDGVGKVGNIVCGDVLWLYIKVDKKEVIKDIKYETFGCAAAIATSSIITDLAKGRTIEEALKIDSGKLVKSLGGLPPIKVHCSLLAIDALSEAIYDYLSKNKKPIPENLQKTHYVIKNKKQEIEERYKEWMK
ncbi:MAG: iron-sulfur cluster assembly scaffold protein [Candidatus Nealsonbacteria bacterium]|nr:iron-sulfur cluster assembly scaffold protein [Candidatus Nealsonbacteria bacterium]